jgi:uncharacterized protein (UPF0332 family)/predicted nucleotidyltransferase
VLGVKKHWSSVSINGVTLEAQNEVHYKKLLALKHFVGELLSSPASESIARVILYGSIAEGDVGEESDVDVLVFGLRPIQLVELWSHEAAFQTMLAMSERVEPLVRTVNDFRLPQSHFVYMALRDGKEIYSMTEEALKRKEIEALCYLASKYLAQAGRHYEPDDEGCRRVAIDLAYNAAELCAKALLLLKVERLPKTHGDVVTLFGDHYIKTGILPASLGRSFGRALAHRNDARYDGDAEISEAMVRTTLDLATELIAILQKEVFSKDEQENDQGH